MTEAASTDARDVCSMPCLLLPLPFSQCYAFFAHFRALGNMAPAPKKKKNNKLLVISTFVSKRLSRCSKYTNELRMRDLLFVNIFAFFSFSFQPKPPYYVWIHPFLDIFFAIFSFRFILIRRKSSFIYNSVIARNEIHK